MHFTTTTVNIGTKVNDQIAPQKQPDLGLLFGNGHTPMILKVTCSIFAILLVIGYNVWKFSVILVNIETS